MTGTRLAAKARRTARAVLRLAPLTITGFMQFSWFGSLVVSSDPYAIVRRDWHQFFLTGHQLLSAHLRERLLLVVPPVLHLPHRAAGRSAGMVGLRSLRRRRDRRGRRRARV